MGGGVDRGNRGGVSPATGRIAERSAGEAAGCVAADLGSAGRSGEFSGVEENGDGGRPAHFPEAGPGKSADPRADTTASLHERPGSAGAGGGLAQVESVKGSFLSNRPNRIF